MIVGCCKPRTEIQNIEYDENIEKICQKNDLKDYDFRRDFDIIKTFTLDLFNITYHIN